MSGLYEGNRQNYYPFHVFGSVIDEVRIWPHVVCHRVNSSQNTGIWVDEIYKRKPSLHSERC